MAPDVCGGLRNQTTSCGKSRHHVQKKGPWTTSEDMLLLEYVKKHGEGNWNAVQRNSGLMRCGKSCRLRWANHLRPNLKKGAFTPEEEKLIVELHSKLGNKWARMAAQLPGRTDNEIKNYWNTRLKRRQRAGLPIYPHELVHHEQNKHPLVVPPPPPLSVSSLLSATRPLNPNQFTFNPSMIAPRDTASYLSNQFNLYRDNNGGLALSLNAANSLFTSPATRPPPPFFNQGMVSQLPMSSLVQYNSLSYDVSTVPEMELIGLPSIQSPVEGAVTPAASSNEFVVAAATSSDGAEEYEVELGFEQRKKSGLLQDLFGDSYNHGKPEVAEAANVHEDGGVLGNFDHGIANSDDTYEGPEAKAPEESSVAMDNDLMNLLDNFPLSVPIPDWNGGDGSESPMLTNGTTVAIESQPQASEYNSIASLTAAANQEWSFGTPCLWNNMTSIY